MTNPRTLVHQWMHSTPGIPVAVLSHPSPSATTQELLDCYEAALSKTAIAGYPLVKGMLLSLHRPLKILLPKVHSLMSALRDPQESAHWVKFTRLLSTSGHSFKRPPDLIRLLTLEFKLVNDEDSEGRNPPWQQIRVFYHGSWDRYLNDRPRLSVSLDKFLKDYTSVPSPVERGFGTLVLRSILGHIDVGDSFEMIRGDAPNAPKVFTEWYTTHVTGGSYPSVSGSCMRYPLGHSHWDSSLADEHPVTVYCTKDIALARLRDDEGRTVCRSLINLVEGTTCRLYNGGTSAQGEAFLGKLGELGYPKSFRLGLKDCHLHRVELEEGVWLMPYLDGHYNQVLEESSDLWRVVSRGGDYACGEQHGVVADENTYYCDHCGQTFRGNDYRSLPHGEVICEGCYTEYYSYCEDCNKIHHYDTLTALDLLGGRTVCERCLSTNYYWCERCEEFNLEGLDENNMCLECAVALGYCHCENCGTYTDDLEDGLCPDCQPTETEEELEATNEAP